MDNQHFNEILEKRIEMIRDTLSTKAQEYAIGDRLYNFKRAADILKTTPEKALLGMLSKHLVSVMDLANGSLKKSDEMINEKVGDAINYLILLEALMKEGMF